VVAGTIPSVKRRETFNAGSTDKHGRSSVDPTAICCINHQYADNIVPSHLILQDTEILLVLGTSQIKTNQYNFVGRLLKDLLSLTASLVSRVVLHAT
jgi:hypothetical protein